MLVIKHKHTQTDRPVGGEIGVLPGLPDADTAVFSPSETDVVDPRLEIGCYPAVYVFAIAMQHTLSLLIIHLLLESSVCVLPYHTIPRLPPFLVRML